MHFSSWIWQIIVILISWWTSSITVWIICHFNMCMLIGNMFNHCGSLKTRILAFIAHELPKNNVLALISWFCFQIGLCTFWLKIAFFQGLIIQIFMVKFYVACHLFLDRRNSLTLKFKKQKLNVRRYLPVHNIGKSTWHKLALSI